MKQLQITILFIFAVIASVSAKRIEFEYNEFGECVVRRSPSVIETSSDIKQGEDVKPSKQVVFYHPNSITDYLEIEFSKGSYKVIFADISGKKIREFDDVAEGLSIDFSELTSGAYIIKVSGNFGDYVRTSHNGLFMHEYGHTIQGRRYGFAYLFAIGIPSLQSAINSSPIVTPLGNMSSTHKLKWFEREASRYGRNFKKNLADLVHLI